MTIFLSTTNLVKVLTFTAIFDLKRFNFSPTCCLKIWKFDKSTFLIVLNFVTQV